MTRKWLFGWFTVVVVVLVALFLPPIQQNETYHQFANHVKHLGIPNFWNVISNVSFLSVAAAAWRRRDTCPIRHCYRILLIGIALTTFGSAYYHAQPSDARLVWDRLPMTIVFVCILTLTIAERIDIQTARIVFWPLLLLGILSVIYWRATGDLRPYALVQFYPLLAVPVMLCLPAKTNRRIVIAQWAMIACYGAAKAAEFFDGRLQGAIPAGAHAWKHLLAALGLFFYTQAISAKPRAGSRLVLPIDKLSANSSKRISRESIGLSKQ